MLLHSVLEQTTGTLGTVSKGESSAKISTEQPKAQKSLKDVGSLKGKRKDMSMAMRHMIETEQSKIVEMYKEMKKNSRKPNK